MPQRPHHYLTDVQHLVDKFEKALAVLLGDLDHLVLLLGDLADRPGAQQLQRADDRSERRAQLVAQGGGELASHATGGALLRDVATLKDDREDPLYVVAEGRSAPISSQY